MPEEPALSGRLQYLVGKECVALSLGWRNLVAPLVEVDAWVSVMVVGCESHSGSPTDAASPNSLNLLKSRIASTACFQKSVFSKVKNAKSVPAAASRLWGGRGWSGQFWLHLLRELSVLPLQHGQAILELEAGQLVWLDK